MKRREWKSRSGRRRGSRPGPPARARQAGVTLIELLVAVTILAVVMLSFGLIIRQMQRVVSTGQANIQSNSAATAIIHTIRTDLMRATQHGMLCITQRPPDGRPCLIVTVAGPTPSKTVGEIGTAGITCIGLCENQSPAVTNDQVLYYQRWVLFGGGTGGDVLDDDLATFQAFSRAGMNSYAGTLASAYPGGPGNPDAVRIPAGDLADVNALWQALADRCEYLSVMWTDGSTAGGGVQWFGVDSGGSISPQGAWQGVTFDENDLSQIEFNPGLPAGNDIYRALWTHHNQNNWPRAVKVRFRLGGFGDQQPREYEIVCPVGR